MPFLLRLYGETRAAELSLAPWTEAQKQAFVAEQFSLQHRHYLQNNPRADFWLIERIEGADGLREPIGRLYLARDDREWRGIELSLLIQARGRGVGGDLLRSIQRAAAQAGADVLTLYVDKANHSARRLYARLGFEETPSPFPSHFLMRFSVDGPSNPRPHTPASSRVNCATQPFDTSSDRNRDRR